jgi:hypothetical protein
MVQLVFVHGVATRDSSDYKTETANRDGAFKNGLFAGQSLTIRSPLWGQFVPKIAKAFDKDVAAAFGGGLGGVALGGGLGDGGLGGLGAGAADSSALADIAQADGTATIDAVFAELIEQADDSSRELTQEEWNAFGAAVDQVAATAPDKPLSLPAAATDDELSAQLAASLSQGPGSYGLNLGKTIGDAIKGVADRVRNVASTGVTDLAVVRLNPLVGRFMGDIFAYLKAGATRDKIRALIAADIQAAKTAQKDEPLILIGHSLGGVILYDMLSDPKGLPVAGLKVDALVTVGSQPGLFQELDVFDAGGGGGLMDGPACVTNWINIFDPIDMFGFPTKGIFKKPEDYRFNSMTGLLDAHTTYFKRPQFHARLRKRLIDHNVIAG